jgi:hypothetical protein
MKAYQVFKGDMDKHDRQFHELIATYLDKQKAFDHAETIANETKLFGSELHFDGWYGLKDQIASWSARGWDIVTIAKLEEIYIIE